MTARTPAWTVTFASVVAALTLGVTAARRQDPPSMPDLMEQSRPGAEHERLAALEGSWKVTLESPGGAPRAGAGSAQSILGGRFLVVDFEVEGVGETRYTLGFDRRHDEWSIVVMDTAGTYFVTARGPEVDGVARMAGTDDDPYMASLGFTKEFEFELGIEGADAFSVATVFLDTRTEARTRIRAAEARFRRE